MSPTRIRQVSTSGQSYATPFVGPVDHPAPVTVDPSTLLAAVDGNGWLRPGTLFTAAGTVAANNAVDQTETVYGVLIEATPVVDPAGAAPTQAELDALPNREVIVATLCQINRDVVEDNYNRALSVSEVAALGRSKGVVVVG